MTEGSLGVVIWFWTLVWEDNYTSGYHFFKNAKGKMLQAKKFAWSLLSNENHENDKASSFYAFGKHHIFKLVCSSMNLLKIIVKICHSPSNIN